MTWTGVKPATRRRRRAAPVQTRPPADGGLALRPSAGGFVVFHRPGPPGALPATSHASPALSTRISVDRAGLAWHPVVYLINYAQMRPLCACARPSIRRSFG